MSETATEPQRPRTKREWQQAVDEAEFWLKVADYRRMGLLLGGPAVDVERCEQTLRDGAKRGVHPGKVG